MKHPEPHRKDPSRSRLFHASIFLIAITSSLCFFPPAAVSETAPKYVLNLDIEELMKTEVTSVSRYNQLLLDAPAAVTVITDEDIRRSGFREMAEILRLVPGMQVARQAASLWFASARAFPDEGVNRMLALSDGRSIYTPGVGRVYWSAQSFLLEDIKQVEVVRGPGGTYWGYNAFHGVVNITHKPARETQGVLIDTGLYDDGTAYGQVRLGGPIGKGVFYRIYFDGSDQDGFKTVQGENAFDGFHKHKLGVRTEYEPGADSRLILDSAIFRGKDGDGWSAGPTETQYDEYYVHARLEHRPSSDLFLMVQAYYNWLDHTFGVTESASGFDVGQKIMDTEFQIDWRVTPRHRVAAGGGAKFSRFDVESGYIMQWYESTADKKRYNAFLADEIMLVPDRLWLTLGTKYEYNDDSEGSWQPSGRLLFKPTPSQSVWGSVSRALRMPYLSDTAERIRPGPMTPYGRSVMHFSGMPVEDEKMISYELGYRNQLTRELSMDVATYFNDIKNINHKSLLSFTPPAGPDDTPVYESGNDYRTSARSYGAEMVVNWQATDQWLLSGSYAYFRTSFDVPNPETWYIPPEKAERHMAQLHSRMDIMRGLQFDTHLYWNNEAVLGERQIPKYLRLDARIAYKPFKKFEIALIAENLLDNQHVEIINGEQEFEHESEIPRRGYLNIKWEF